ncbi:MAG TPA: DMT family transporter [Burkholderiales bacterium]|nr:DMT family transporter [Burkholderiales bacterium]
MSTSAVTRSPRFGIRALSALFVVLWSSAWIAGKIALTFTGPLSLLELRFSAAALVMLLVASLTGARWPSRWSEYAHLAVAGVLVNVLTLAALYIGLDDGVSAGVSALIGGLTPLLTAFAARPLFGERIAAGQWAGLIIGLLGVALVVSDKISFATGSWHGYLATFLALGAFVAGTLYQKRFCSALDLRTGNFVQFAIAAIVLLLPALRLEGLQVHWSEALVMSWVWLVLANSVAAVSLLYLFLRQGEASRVATLFYLVPPITAAMGFVAFHETLGPIALLGFGLAALGVYFGAGSPAHKIGDLPSLRESDAAARLASEAAHKKDLNDGRSCESNLLQCAKNLTPS